MLKKINITFAVVVVVAIAIGVWWFLFRVPAPVIAPETKNTQVVQAVKTSQKAQDAASASIDQANPFHADVNPMSGYKNPFE